MTEAEARQKLCPLMLIAMVSPGASDERTNRCEGSACMMWRWVQGGGAKVFGHCGMAGPET